MVQHEMSRGGRLLVIVPAPSSFLLGYHVYCVCHVTGLGLKITVANSRSETYNSLQVNAQLAQLAPNFSTREDVIYTTGDGKQVSGIMARSTQFGIKPAHDRLCIHTEY